MDYVKNKIMEIKNLVETYVEKSQSKLILSTLTNPTYSPYGIYETKSDFGLQEMIIKFNGELFNLFKNNSLVFIYNFNQFITKFGEMNVFDYKQYFLGDVKISMNYIPSLANELMGYVKATLGLNKKCIVLDLDNTLWGGIVGEDGYNGIVLGDTPSGKAFVEFQKILLSLHQRGIILAINSKNNKEDAMEVIKNHPNMVLSEENFACMKINWNDKFSNMQEISNELNIGLESMVFFDDDPVNRELIRSTIPQVLTPEIPEDPSQYPMMIQNLNDFDVLNITNEDTKRGEMYLQQRKRTELSQKSQNLDEFLKQMNIKVKIKSASEFTLPRISQLTLKTNQFNLTTKRYQEEDIRNFSCSSDKIVGSAQVIDKFGDNGITGVFIVNKDSDKEWSIDTLLLSCRVMGRGIEDGILDHIISQARIAGISRIKANYIPSKKNKPVENFLPNFGFKKEDGDWHYYVDEKVKKPKHIEIIVEK
jgi:FkbH-like protein